MMHAQTAAGLELQGVRKTYGTLVAVDDLDLAVRPCELFGFVGSNGAGKTTTMRVVLGTLIPIDVFGEAMIESSAAAVP